MQLLIFHVEKRALDPEVRSQGVCCERNNFRHHTTRLGGASHRVANLASYPGRETYSPVSLALDSRWLAL